MDFNEGAAVRRQRELYAAKKQGLLALLADLERYGLTAEIENAGGYCMVLIRAVRTADGREEFVVASHDDHWYVARYTAAEWYGGDYSARGLPIPHGFAERSEAAAAFEALFRDAMPHTESFDARY